jgi:glycosyltransferase involved in cell wall biosynthesis
MQSILRKATQKLDGKFNILTCPTHESYETELAKTGHEFYAWQGENIKTWEPKYRPIPDNYHLLNPALKEYQLPNYVDFDLVLSQNKFGQYPVLSQIARILNIPLICLEHTLPMNHWPKLQLQQMKGMRGNVNIFISEYSKGKWGWAGEEAVVIHHGVDTELFKPNKGVEKQSYVLSVVNDFLNRAHCCGTDLWRHLTGWPNQPKLPYKILGNSPGLSEAAKSVGDLIHHYQEASVFLNTSNVSPIPTVVLEAMSCGLVPVSTNNCMLPEIINNGVNGFLSNNPDELRNYCLLLLNDKQLATKMGEAARQTIIDKFSLTNFTNNWNKVFYGAVNAQV